MTDLVYVLNGSNLNMLGKREPHLYGTTTLAQIQQQVETLAARLELKCEFRQTNSEATMVDWLQEAFERDAAVIINPAGFSFASVPVFDAVKLMVRLGLRPRINGDGIVINQRPDPGTPLDQTNHCELWLERAPRPQVVVHGADEDARP